MPRKTQAKKQPVGKRPPQRDNKRLPKPRQPKRQPARRIPRPAGAPTARLDPQMIANSKMLVHASLNPWDAFDRGYTQLGIDADSNLDAYYRFATKTVFTTATVANGAKQDLFINAGLTGIWNTATSTGFSAGLPTGSTTTNAPGTALWATSFNTMFPIAAGIVVRNVSAEQTLNGTIMFATTRYDQSPSQNAATTYSVLASSPGTQIHSFNKPGDVFHAALNLRSYDDNSFLPTDNITASTTKDVMNIWVSGSGAASVEVEYYQFWAGDVLETAASLLIPTSVPVDEDLCTSLQYQCFMKNPPSSINRNVTSDDGNDSGLLDDIRIIWGGLKAAHRVAKRAVGFFTSFVAPLFGRAKLFRHLHTLDEATFELLIDFARAHPASTLADAIAYFDPAEQKVDEPPSPAQSRSSSWGSVSRPATHVILTSPNGTARVNPGQLPRMGS